MNQPSIPARRASVGNVPEITLVEAAESEVRRSVIIALAVMFMFAIGFATYVGVKEALRQVRASGLAALRDAEVRSLEIWMEQRVASAERWAGQSMVRENVARISAGREGVSGHKPACESEEAKRITELLAPAMHERGFVTWEVIDPGGTVLASRFPEYCGLRAKAATFMARIEESLAGRSMFLRPLPERDRLSNAPSGRFGGPLVWVAVPVRATDGVVIATLALGEPAGTRFSTVLSPPGLGETDEVYAFDENAVLLTDLRHPDKVREAGLLRQPSLSRTILNMEVRDPGGDLLEGHVPAEELSARPRTRLAALAIAAQNKAGEDEKHGVLIDTYRNYRGVEVIGAWRWLDRYGMGVAMEIERDEGYAPLRTLDRAFGMVLGLAVAISVGVLISLLGAVRERLRFGRVRRLGRYTLLKSVGEGGMAQVYLGRHALLKRMIAVKILKRQASDEVIARFEREVQLASRLGHPNIVEIYDYGHTRSGEFYYVMEYIEGITLADLAAGSGPLPAGRIVFLLRQICSALNRAHQLGIIHRDIKPENIMVCVRGGEHDVIKILDFGLVKSLRDDNTRDITHSVLRVLGTPVYMSPERFADPAVADVRADIYAVGAVAYQLATGRRLFDGLAGEELRFQILHSPPAKPSALPGTALPAELDAIILACLAKRPEDRPQSAQEIMDRLRELAISHPWSERDAAMWWESRMDDADRPPAP